MIKFEKHFLNCTFFEESTSLLLLYACYPTICIVVVESAQQIGSIACRPWPQAGIAAQGALFYNIQGALLAQYLGAGQKG